MILIVATTESTRMKKDIFTTELELIRRDFIAIAEGAFDELEPLVRQKIIIATLNNLFDFLKESMENYD